MPDEALDSGTRPADGITATIEADSKSLAADKAVFEKFVRAREGKPEKAPKAEKPIPEKKKSADDEPKDDEKEEEPHMDDPATGVAYDKARKNLHLRKIGDEIIEKLGEEGAIKLWDSMRERERAFDEAFRQRKKAGPEKQPDATKETEEPAPPTSDLDLEALRPKFAEHYGEEAGGFLAEVIAKVHAENATRNQQLEDKLSARDEADMRQAESEARVVLGERFPELDDPIKLHEVREVMALLVKHPRYSTAGRLDVQALMEDAARAARLQEVTEESDEARETKKKDRETRKEGTAQVATRTQPKALTEEGEDRQIFEELSRSRDPLRARVVMAKHGR